MIRLVFATLVLAIASCLMVGCEKKLTIPTASPKETAEGKAVNMTVPSNPGFKSN
jgi:hypothetical protein